MIRALLLRWLGEVKIIGGPLSVVRLENGQRELNRKFPVVWRGMMYTPFKGFTTDYSSIPYRLIQAALTLSIWWFGLSPLWFFLIFLVPNQMVVDIAGVVHDWVLKERAMSLNKAAMFWMAAALSGESHATGPQAIACGIGLYLYGVFVRIKERVAYESRRLGARMK